MSIQLSTIGAFDPNTAKSWSNSEPTEDAAPYLWGIAGEEGKAYLPKGAAVSQYWVYFSSLLTFPLFDTYADAKETLTNRIYPHDLFIPFRKLGYFDSFGKMCKFVTWMRNCKGESFVPKAQVDAIIGYVQKENPSFTTQAIVQSLFPINESTLLHKTEVGKLLHAKLKARMNQYRNQEIKTSWTQAKTAFVALFIFKGFSKLFQILVLFINNWRAKRKFDSIFYNANSSMIRAGRPRM